MTVICSGPQQDQDTKGEVGAGEGQEGTKTKNDDKTCEGLRMRGGRRKEGGFCSPVSRPRKQ